MAGVLQLSSLVKSVILCHDTQQALVSVFLPPTASTATTTSFSFALSITSVSRSWRLGHREASARVP